MTACSTSNNHDGYTGSNKYTLKEMEKHISANGKKTVVIHVDEYCPFLGTADMAYFCSFVEMNRADVGDVDNKGFSLDFNTIDETENSRARKFD